MAGNPSSMRRVDAGDRGSRPSPPVRLARCEACQREFKRWRYPSGKLALTKTCGARCARKAQVAAFKAGLLPAIRPQRRCLVCGKLFELWRVGKRRVWTKATLCTRSCQNIAKSSAMEGHHERAKSDPEQYRAWVERDYAAMGRARHAKEHRQGAKLTSSKTTGKGWTKGR